MKELSGFQSRTRATRLAQARAAISRAKKHTATRPGATGNEIIRNLIDVAADLITELELPATGETI